MTIDAGVCAVQWIDDLNIGWMLLKFDYRTGNRNCNGCDGLVIFSVFFL